MEATGPRGRMHGNTGGLKFYGACLIVPQGPRPLGRHAGHGIYLRGQSSRLCAGVLRGILVRPPGGFVRSFV